MSANTYRLQSVWDVREAAKQQAARALAARREQLAEAEAELAARSRAIVECQREQAALRNRMFERTDEAQTASHLLAHSTRLADLRHTEEELTARREQQRSIVERRANEVDEATDKLIEAAKETQVIEKHHAGWRLKRVREDERRDQKINDEIGALRHTRRC